MSEFFKETLILFNAQKGSIKGVLILHNTFRGVIEIHLKQSKDNFISRMQKTYESHPQKNYEAPPEKNYEGYPAQNNLF